MRSAILVVTMAIALVQLEIAVSIVTGAFLLAFGALALSFALAFGLGSRRAVETMWDEHFRRRRALAPADQTAPKAGEGAAASPER